MSSTLRSSKLLDLCTQSISYDRQVQSACQAFDNQMYEIIDETGPPDASLSASAIAPTNPFITFIPFILSIADSTLVDILAWQFHVDFYDPTLPLADRRQLVFNSIQWHMRKGTVALLQEVLDFFFPGGATIEEWFEYMDPLPPNFPIVDFDEWRADFQPPQVNTGQDRFQVNDPQCVNDEKCFFVQPVGSTLPAPLVAGTTYYVVQRTTAGFKVSATLGGAPVNLTNSGVGRNEIWHKADPAGNWHDRYRFRASIDVAIIPPEKEAEALALINEYKPVSRWFEGFYQARVSECDIAWYGVMLRFVNRTSDAPDRGTTDGGDLVIDLPPTPALGSAVASYSSITLTWGFPEPSPSLMSAPVTGFRIYRGLESGGNEKVIDVGPDVTNYVDTDVIAGTTYYYRVASVSGVLEGVASNEIAATLLVFIDVLTNLLGHWKLDEVGGATPRVESRGIGSLALGQVPNTSDYSGTPGIIGTSHGSGASCYLTVNDSPAWNFAGSVTFTGWLYPLTFGPHSLMGMFTKWAGDGGCQCALFLNGYTSPAQWMFMASNTGMGTGTGIVVGVSSEEGTSMSAWHFVVAWYDHAAHQLGIQIDNGTVFTAPFTGPIFHAATPASLHTFYDGTTIYQSSSLLDEFTVHNGRVLPPLERAWLYNGGAGRPFSSYV